MTTTTKEFNPFTQDKQILYWANHAPEANIHDKEAMLVIDLFYSLYRTWERLTKMMYGFQHYQINVWSRENTDQSFGLDYDIRESMLNSYVLLYNQYYEESQMMQQDVLGLFTLLDDRLLLKIPSNIHVIWFRHDDMGILMPISLAFWPKDPETGAYLFGRLPPKGMVYITNGWITY